jgi:hypothetical protein
MRFYNITIVPVGGVAQYYTTVGGLNPVYGNYSSLQVELDIMQAPMHQPAQLGTIKIKGVAYEDISLAANLNGAFIQVAVGMSYGLPLADPTQIGIIVEGNILQAFGNWQGTNVSLDIVFGPAAFANNSQNPANIVWNWLPAQTMQASIVEAILGSNLARYPVIGQISPLLIGNQTLTVTNAFHADFTSFAKTLKRVSQQIIPADNYQGVEIAFNKGAIRLYDGTFPPSALPNSATGGIELAPPKLVLVNYEDLIGNITYIQTNIVQAKIVMRGNLELGDYVQFPPGSPVSLTLSTSPENVYKNSVPFAGLYRIVKIHHMGNSRQADANSWVTVLDCVIPALTYVPIDILTLINAIGYSPN